MGLDIMEFCGISAGPFQLPEKRLFTCFSSWFELKKQLQCKAHVEISKTAPVNSRGYRMSAVYFPSFHNELLTEGRATLSLKWYLGFLWKHFRGCLRSVKMAFFSLIICLWHAWRVIFTLQHFIRFLNFPFLRNPALIAQPWQLTETSCTHP